MGTGYQEEKKEQCEKMMEEIAGHPDFGKRNPVDIGIECGYREEAVLEMICFLQDIKDGQKTKNVLDTVTAAKDAPEQIVGSDDVPSQKPRKKSESEKNEFNWKCIWKQTRDGKRMQKYEERSKGRFGNCL